MKLTSVCVGAFVLLVQTSVGPSQGSRPQLLIDPVEAPVFIQEFNYVESQPPLAAAVLRVIPTSREKITTAAILITYWRQGRPVAGRIYPVYENALSGAVPLRIRLDFQRTRADSVVASVFKAQGPTLNWVLPSEHLRSLGQRLFPGVAMPQVPAAETVAPEPYNVRPASDNGCMMTLGDCVAAARAACGERGVGGVTFSSKTCTCCFYCSGELPADCGGDQ